MTGPAKGMRSEERLAKAHAGARRQDLGQRACLLFCIFGNIHYASNLPLRSLRLCPFKGRVGGEICQRCEGEPSVLSQLYDHTIIYTEALDLEV